MPARKRPKDSVGKVGRKCPQCKKVAEMTVVGAPPAIVNATCGGCGATFQVCGAIKRKTDVSCFGMPMANGRCRLHGGTSTGAPPTNGRRSKYFPVRLMDRVEEALADGDLIALREDIALMDALIVERASDLGEVTQAELWKSAMQVNAEINRMQRDKLVSIGGESDEIVEYMTLQAGLDNILNNGFGESQRIADILTFVEQKRKLSDTELKRLTALSQFMTAQQANLMIAAILNAVKEEVDDGGVRARLGNRLLELLR